MTQLVCFLAGAVCMGIVELYWWCEWDKPFVPPKRRPGQS